METLGRRDLFKIIGTAGMAAGASSCSGVVDELMPLAPLRRRAGPQKQVATACAACTAGCGISVRVVGDDAVRLNGVAGHPVNDGGLCPRGIAEIQNLYHPDRLQTPGEKDGSGHFKPLTWDAAVQKVVQSLNGNVVIGVGAASALEHQLLRKIAAKTGAQLVPVALASGSRPTAGYELFFGNPGLQPDFGNADLVVSLGSDWLQSTRSPVESQRAFAKLRGGEKPVRIVTAEPRLSVTGSRSDSWVPVSYSGMALFALGLARVLVTADASRAQRLPGLATLLASDKLTPEAVAKSLDIPQRSLEKTAEAIRNAKRPLIIVEGSADVPTQIAATALQILAGDAGAGIIRRNETSVPPVLVSDAKEVPALAASVAGAAVLLFNANPLFLQPHSAWGETLQKARFVGAISSFADETTLRADVVLPPSTSLESRQLTWGAAIDGKPFVSGGPAAVKPLYQTLEGVEVLTRLARGLDPTLPWKSADDVFGAITEPLGAGKIIDEGGSARPDAPAAVELALLPDASNRAADILRGTVGAAVPGFGSPQFISFVPLAFGDGLGAHLPFLHGITGTGGREVWRTIIELHPHAAEHSGITDGSPIVVESPQGSIRGLARVREGIRPDNIAVAVGLGRTAGGRWAAGHGDNPLALTPPGAAVVGVVVRRA